MICWTLFWAAALLVVAVAGGDVEHLTGKAGHNITLVLGAFQLQPSDVVIWSRYFNETLTVIVSYDQGTLRRSMAGSEMDQKSGSLTIQNLTREDAGLYKAQISNGKWLTRVFKLTVEPDPVQSTVDLSQITTLPPEHHRNRIWTAVVVSGSVLFCTVVLIYAVIKAHRDSVSADKDPAARQPEDEVNLQIC